MAGESQSAPQAKEKGLRGALTRILTNGLASYLKKDLGIPIKDDEGEEVRVGMLRAWFNSKKEQAGNSIKEAVVESVANPEVQEYGARHVREAIGETITEVRGGFDETIQNTARKLSEETVKDTRSSYQKIRSLLGENKDDKWYQRLGKSMVARVGAVGLPILTLISSKLAAKFTGSETKKDQNAYIENFDTIYSGLLSKMSQPKAA